MLIRHLLTEQMMITIFLYMYLFGTMYKYDICQRLDGIVLL